MTSFLENIKHLRMDAQGEMDPTMGPQYRHNWVESSQFGLGSTFYRDHHILSRSRSKDQLSLTFKAKNRGLGTA